MNNNHIRLFNIVGNIANSKQAALLPENVNELVFLHENMPPVDLNFYLNANVMLVHNQFDFHFPWYIKVMFSVNCQLFQSQLLVMCSEFYQYSA